MVTGGAQAGTTYYYNGNYSLDLRYEKTTKGNGVTDHKCITARVAEVYASLQFQDTDNAIVPDKINFDDTQDVLNVSSVLMESLTGSTLGIKQRAKVKKLQKLSH